ncbi:MAG: hypothetical protein ACFFG0_30325 [Candidatus Thorarchaeota archaeon]
MSLLFFQSLLPLLKADTETDGPLEVYTSDNYIYLDPGEDVTINWLISVPSHDYAVYWEIIGYGVSLVGWGLNANCTTPIIPSPGTDWSYDCDVYYAKYHVLSTVHVRSHEEPSEEPTDGNGGDGVVIPGFAPYLFFLVFSTLTIGIIFIFYYKFKNQKFEK